MGTCDSNNRKYGRTNDILINDSKMYPIDSCLYKVCPSICKISYSNKVGTSFFIKLNRSINHYFY